MKPKTMILMVVAVTCGLGASYMTSRLLAERETPEVPKVKFLIANKTLDQGTTLKKPEELFTEKVVNEGEEPKGAIVDIALLKNRIVIRPRRAGDAIFPDDLLDPEKGYGPQGTMPEGYRGFGIRVNPEQIAGGWASLPNSRVDIISTIKGSSHKDSKALILLQDVLVIAADQSVGTPEAGKAMMAATVTVAVKPEDMLKLSLAEQYGPLRLVVRKYNDKTRPDNDSVNFETVLNGSGPNKGEIDQGPPETTTIIAKTEPKIEQPKSDPGHVEPPPIERPTQVVAPKVEIVEDVKPVRTTHTVTIVQGNRIIRQDYVLDEDGNILSYSGPGGATEQQVPQPTPGNGQRKDGP